MVKSVTLIGRKKASAGAATGGHGGGKRKTLKEYHSEWSELLKNSLLPLLRRAMHDSSLALLSTQVEVLRHHLSSYYDALDLALTDPDPHSSAAAVAAVLHPSDHRSPLERPFLWLGGLHPYLFTNLLRSFLDSDNHDDDETDDSDDSALNLKLRARFALLNETNELFNRPWHIVTAWKSPPPTLMAGIDQIECGVRLMVPALTARARKAQARFVAAVSREWPRSAGNEAVIEKAMAAQMEEMVGVIVDANRLRRSVLCEIVAATSVYQAALFLEGLSQFLLGFRDSDLLSDFESCKTPLRKINLSLPSLN